MKPPLWRMQMSLDRVQGDTRLMNLITTKGILNLIRIYSEYPLEYIGDFENFLLKLLIFDQKILEVAIINSSHIRVYFLSDDNDRKRMSSVKGLSIRQKRRIRLYYWNNSIFQEKSLDEAITFDFVSVWMKSMFGFTRFANFMKFNLVVL